MITSACIYPPNFQTANSRSSVWILVLHGTLLTSNATELNSDLTRPIIETNASSDLKLSYNYGSNVIINNQIAFASLQPRTAKSITSNMTLPFSLPHHSAVFFIGQYNDSSSISVYGTGFANSNGTIRFDAIVGEEFYRIFCIFFTW